MKLLFSLFRGHHVACSFALMSIALTSASSVSAQAVTYLTIETGHSMTVSVPGLTRIAVGDERIAGVVAIGRSQVVINGKAPGRTTVFIWSDEGRASYEVAVQGQGLDDMVPIIRAALAISVPRTFRKHGGMGRALAMHADIANAIERRDGAGAALAMQRLLEDTYDQNFN